VIGVGNALRGDDGAGPAVMDRLKATGMSVQTCSGGTELFDLWRGADAVVLVDAVATGAPPGTIHRLDAGIASLPPPAANPGTHALGLRDALELARVLECLPDRVVVYGIEAGTFDLGAPMSDAVIAALPLAAARVREEAARLA
jgi:hydrogenase maturation protease